MKKLIQTLFLSILIINIYSPSNAFIGATVKAIKSATYIVKTKSITSFSKFSSLFKIGAADSGVRMIDNVANEALSVRKLNQNLISKIKKSEEEELINLIKNEDEIVLSNYKNIDEVNVNDDQISWWLYLNPKWRYLTKDLKPENFIYACETNSGAAYYFSLLPKRNMALVSASTTMIDSQRLQIVSSSAKGTVLKGLNNESEIDHFFLLPNYQFYVGKLSVSNETEIIPNGSCYNTEIDFDNSSIKYVQYEIPKTNKNKSFIEKNLRYYSYICFAYVITAITLLLKNYLIGKSKKRAEKYLNISYSIGVLNIITFNLFGAGAALIILQGVNLATLSKILFWVIYIWYIFSIWQTFKESYKSYKNKQFNFISNIDFYITLIIFILGLIIYFG